MTWSSYVESLETRLEKMDKLVRKVYFTLTLLPVKYSSINASSCSPVLISARKSINFSKKIRILKHNMMKTKTKKLWSENWPHSISTQRRIGSSESRGKKKHAAIPNICYIFSWHDVPVDIISFRLRWSWKVNIREIILLPLSWYDVDPSFGMSHLWVCSWFIILGSMLTFLTSGLQRI